MRAHLLQEFANTMHERDVPLRRLYGDGFVVDEMIWEVRITGRVGSLVGNGRRVTQRILRIFELRDGRVAHQSVYFGGCTGVDPSSGGLGGGDNSALRDAFKALAEKALPKI